jgi:(2Fe-2S) ferredoxin
MPKSPRYVVESPASVKDSHTGTIWYTCDNPSVAQGVADSHNRVQEARAAGCVGVCGFGPGTANCRKCWSVIVDNSGIRFMEQAG